MRLRQEVTYDAESAPDGPHIGAFFDLDQTLIAGFSAVEFIREGFREGLLSKTDLLETLFVATQFELGQRGFSDFVTGTSHALAGVPEADYRRLGERIFTERLATNIYPEARALVRAHQRKGHRVAIISSATRYQVEPLASDLGIDDVLCTEMEVVDGALTGRVLRPTVYGVGKARVARKLASTEGLNLAESFFYTDSDEDLPLLDIVGKPRPTNPNRHLREIAIQRGWPICDFHSRGTPGPMPILRTALAVSSLLPALALAAPAAILDGSLRSGLNAATSTFGELGLALAGIDLQVTGEQHLWSKRPAVFLFNHQSGIEMVALCKLLRRDFVGVAKEEVRSNPFFGPAMALAGTVFIDREDRARAIDAMQPAVDTLRQGLSIVVAPEGTRSSTGKLGAFKKGPFHLAMAAKAPIVPIVFRNSADALPKHAYFVRPTTIEVVVHKPISTKKWKPSELDENIARVRRIFLDTLAENP